MASFCCCRRKNIIILSFLLMFILDMVYSAWTADQQKLFGQFDVETNLGWSERERARIFWRRKNRNRQRARQQRLNAMNLPVGIGQKRGMKLGRRNLPQTPLSPLEPFMYVTESLESCCPTVTELVEPLAGRNRSGHLVELYQAEPIRQRFFEYSCEKGIMNKPCKFLENRHSKQSKCTQQHTYTYALVRPQGTPPPEPKLKMSSVFVDQPWALDYIMIRSGCSCQVVKNQKRRQQQLEFSRDF